MINDTFVFFGLLATTLFSGFAMGYIYKSIEDIKNAARSNQRQSGE
jgi:hypothetical protein